MTKKTSAWALYCDLELHNILVHDAFERRSLMWCYTYMNATITFLGHFNDLTDNKTTLYAQFLVRIIYDGAI